MAFDFPATPTTGQTIAMPDGTIRVWDGAKWVAGGSAGVASYLPLAGGTMAGLIGFFGAQASLMSLPLVFAWSGKPAAGAQIFMPAAIAFSIAANLTGSQAIYGTAPAASAAFTLARSGTTIGTITIPTTGPATFSGAGGSVAVGQYLTMTAPATQDAALASPSIVILATRA